MASIGKDKYMVIKGYTKDTTEKPIKNPTKIVQTMFQSDYKESCPYV